MILRLEGYLSHIDESGRLVFIYTSPDTYARLAEHCVGKVPFTDDSFTVSCKRAADIQAMVGSKCVVDVKIQRYLFYSKFERNYGQRIDGCKLVLKNITEWSASTGHHRL
jgi:hypothetical protein